MQTRNEKPTKLLFAVKYNFFQTVHIQTTLSDPYKTHTIIAATFLISLSAVQEKGKSLKAKPEKMAPSRGQ